MFGSFMAKEPKQKEASVEKQSGGTGSTETFNYAASSSAQLKTLEEELFELVQLSEVPLDKELFKEILELLKVNVAPAAILQVLSDLSSLENGRRSATPTEGGSTFSGKEPDKPDSGQGEDSSDCITEPLPPSLSGVSAPRPPKGTLSKQQSKPSKLKRPK